MQKILPSVKNYLPWLLIGILGTIAFAYIALVRGETISSIWLVTACICIQLIAYRFYSFFYCL